MICQRVAFAGVARPLARRAREWIAALCVLIAAVMLLAPQDASAQDCSRAGARGAAPSSWQTYCWLNMSNYSDAQARSTGQPMSYVLPDGSRLTFRLQVAVTPTATGTALVSAAAPSWTGAAVGNSSFLNIPGRPILYQATNGTVTTLTLTNIAIIPPGGVTQANQYAFVVADAESTDNSEYQQYTTNGGAWQLLDRVAPRSGTQYPVSTGINTTTFRTAGGGQTGNVGAYIVSSLNPTSVTITMQGSGLQGVMLAIRFASITLSKTIAGTRIADNDQFRFVIESQNGATTYASGQTSGTDLGPFPAAVFSSTSGVPLVLREAMVAGSTSALADYRASLTCTNINSGSTTSLPRDVVTNSYNFGTLQFGDFVDCVFTNTPLPRLQLRTAIAAPGRIFGTDQFTLAIRNQTANTELASFTTTGTGTTATPAATGLLGAIAGNSYLLSETANGSTVLARYSPTLACANRNATSTTALPAGGATGTLTPQLGDVITCTITNTRSAARPILSVDKTSRIVSDPTGSANPKAIPGAVIEYMVTVTNSGDAPTDASTLRLVDIPSAALAWRTDFPPVFIDGATVSGLAFNGASNVAYSNQPGGTVTGYSPLAPFDPAVTGIRFSPSGTLRASNGTAHPSFTLRYRMVIE